MRKAVTSPLLTFRRRRSRTPLCMHIAIVGQDESARRRAEGRRASIEDLVHPSTVLPRANDRTPSIRRHVARSVDKTLDYTWCPTRLNHLASAMEGLKSVVTTLDVHHPVVMGSIGLVRTLKGALQERPCPTASRFGLPPVFATGYRLRTQRIIVSTRGSSGVIREIVGN